VTLAHQGLCVVAQYKSTFDIDIDRSGELAPELSATLTQYTPMVSSNSSQARPPVVLSQTMMCPIDGSEFYRRVPPTGQSSTGGSKFYRRFRVLPMGQSSTGGSEFYRRFRVLPMGQSSTDGSEFYRRVRVLPTVQSSTDGSEFYRRFRILPTGQSSTDGSEFY